MSARSFLKTRLSRDDMREMARRLHPLPSKLTQFVWIARRSIDIVGVGGVRTGTDAFELILCGASAVQGGWERREAKRRETSYEISQQTKLTQSQLERRTGPRELFASSGSWGSLESS